MNTESKTETAGYAVVKKVYEGEIDFSEVSAGDARLPTPAERIRHHLSESHALGRLSLAHLLFAGWELFRQKTQLGYGKWESWCKAELGFSKDTADRYIGFFLATVGESRRLAGRDMSAEVSDKEMEAATVGMEHKSATRAMVDLGIMKRPPKWGGDRRERAAENGHAVGRPVVPSPEERSRRDWIAVLAPMRKLTDVSYRFLPLADASAALADLDAARERLMARIEELKRGGIRKGDWDEAPEEAEP